GAEVDPAEGGGDLGQDDVLEPAGDVTGVFESGDEAHAVFAHVVLSDRRTEGGARVDEHGDDPAVHGADHGRDLVLLGEHRGRGSEAGGGEGLLDYLECGHGVLVVDEAEATLDIAQSSLGETMLVGDLGAASAQQTGETLCVDPPVED